MATIRISDHSFSFVKVFIESYSLEYLIEDVDNVIVIPTIKTYVINMAASSQERKTISSVSMRISVWNTVSYAYVISAHLFTSALVYEQAIV